MKSVCWFAFSMCSSVGRIFLTNRPNLPLMVMHPPLGQWSLAAGRPDNAALTGDRRTEVDTPLVRAAEIPDRHGRVDVLRDHLPEVERQRHRAGVEEMHTLAA